VDRHLNRKCTAFAGSRRIATGELLEVVRAAKTVVDHDPSAAILIFDDLTSEPIEIDFRGRESDVVRRLDASQPPPANEAPRGRGRPKLGVVAREVTLLPRHWEWLTQQPGGASVTLRRLVDDARRSSGGRDRTRAAQEATYRFMSVMAGNEAGFEEAARALFAPDPVRFTEHITAWPPDVRQHVARLAANAFDDRSDVVDA
jgi:uncharacterized protein